MIKAKLLASAVLFLFGIGLNECIAPRPTREQLIGRWVETRHPKSAAYGAACAYIDLLQDGRFVARQIPSSYFVGPTVPTSRMDGEGVWFLQAPPASRLDVQEVELQFQGGINFDTRVQVAPNGRQPALFVWDGDPSNSIFFEKGTGIDCD